MKFFSAPASNENGTDENSIKDKRTKRNDNAYKLVESMPFKGGYGWKLLDQEVVARNY